MPIHSFNINTSIGDLSGEESFNAFPVLSSSATKRSSSHELILMKFCPSIPDGEVLEYAIFDYENICMKYPACQTNNKRPIYSLPSVIKSHLHVGECVR